MLAKDEGRFASRAEGRTFESFTVHQPSLASRATARRSHFAGYRGTCPAKLSEAKSHTDPGAGISSKQKHPRPPQSCLRRHAGGERGQILNFGSVE